MAYCMKDNFLIFLNCTMVEVSRDTGTSYLQCSFKWYRKEKLYRGWKGEKEELMRKQMWWKVNTWGTWVISIWWFCAVFLQLFWRFEIITEEQFLITLKTTISISVSFMKGYFQNFWQRKLSFVVYHAFLETSGKDQSSAKTAAEIWSLQRTASLFPFSTWVNKV